MTFVEILDVALSDLDTGQLWGRNIEAPKTQSRIGGDTIPVGGWVLGRSSPAITVEVVHAGKVLQRAPIDAQRLDIVDAFPRVPGAEHSGFRTNVAIPDLREFELLLRTILENEETVSLGVVRAHQRREGEESKGERSVQGQSKPPARERTEASGGFFRRLFGQGGG
jgi:hypothetical protein